jgi:hypothetical protein
MPRSKSRAGGRQAVQQGRLGVFDVPSARTRLSGFFLRPTNLRRRVSRLRCLVLFGARLAFNRTVVLRYRIHLEQRDHAPPPSIFTARCSARSKRPAVSGEMARRRMCSGMLSAPRRLGPGSTSWPHTPATHLRPSLPPCGGRTGPDPVSALPRLHPDKRALSRMQAEAPNCGERPIGSRTRCHLTRTPPGRMLQSALGDQEC